MSERPVREGPASAAPSGRTVLIAEGNPGGHRFYYVGLLARDAVSAGDRVVLVITKAVTETQVVDTFLGDLAGEVELVVTGSGGLLEIEQISRDQQADITVIPDADSFLLPLVRRGGWKGPGRLSLLVMRRGAQPRRVKGHQAVLTAFKTGLILVVGILPRTAVSVLRSPFESQSRLVQTVPDPVSLTASESDAEDLRAAWSLERGRTWFAVLGAITPRKNVGLVMEAMAGVTSGPRGLLLAGRLDSSTRDVVNEMADLLEASGCQLVVVDAMLSESDLDAAVRVSDCLVLAHSNEGPSGLFGKAMAAGTYVVAAGAISLRRDVGNNSGMAVWGPLTAAALTAQLDRAVGVRLHETQPLIGSDQFTRTLLL